MTKHICLGIPFWDLEFVCHLFIVFWTLLRWWVKERQRRGPTNTLSGYVRPLACKIKERFWWVCANLTHPTRTAHYLRRTQYWSR